MPVHFPLRLRQLWPEPLHATRQQILLRALGAALSLWACGSLSARILGAHPPWFIAPMGASAVLLMAVPASPLAQPWPLLAGNLLSALAGVTVVQLLGVSPFAAGLAVGLAMVVMSAARCLHPPGGAIALGCVIGGDAIVQAGYHYVTGPVLLNSLLMLGAALLLNRLSGTQYPHRPPVVPSVHHTHDPLPSQRVPWQQEDLQQVLDTRHDMLDVSTADLAQLLREVNALARKRSLDTLRCRDIMARDVVAVRHDTPLSTVWALLQTHKVRVLPVLDAQDGLLGIMSLHGLFMQAGPDTPQWQIDWSAPAARYMLTGVDAVRADAPLSVLRQRFTDGGLHHLPVLDEAGTVVGMLSQSDFLACLLSQPD